MAKILVTWVARTNDPYEKKRDHTIALNDKNEPLFGPTLTLLYDQNSDYCEKIDEVALFYRRTKGYEEDLKNVEKLENIIGNRAFVRKHKWDGEDPTDHKAIYKFVIKQLREIRKNAPGAELIINISPGTPSMQMVWFLIAENELIEMPYRLVKTLKRNEAHDGKLVVETSLGIKLEKTVREFQGSQPLTATSENLPAQVDPRQFKSQRMLELYAKAARFAALNIPILILGERGTGKSYLANWIRTNSPFRKKVLDNGWPAVACGQYSKSDSSQLQAELFGSKVGAYTDSKKDRDGLLKKANLDTLFLDEIGDISQGTQRLLIKAIEEKKFFPLGSDTPEYSVFRLITATNKPLDLLLKQIDPDFFDRICQLVLIMPPLREIREDIPLIWRAVFDKTISNSKASIQKEILENIPHDEISLFLQNHTLHGNYRDLQRLANNIVILLHRSDSAIDLKSVLSDAQNSISSTVDSQATALSHFQPTSIEQAVLPDSALPNLADGFSIEAYLSEVRRNLILHALEQSSGNQRKAASLLGISPQAINKFKKTK